MSLRDIHTVPPIGVDRILNDIMRPAFGAEESDAVLPVAVNEIIHNERIGVVGANQNTARALAGAVTEDAVAFQPDALVVVFVAAYQSNGLAAGIGNRESS